MDVVIFVAVVLAPVFAVLYSLYRVSVYYDKKDKESLKLFKEKAQAKVDQLNSNNTDLYRIEFETVNNEMLFSKVFLHSCRPCRYIGSRYIEDYTSSQSWACHELEQFYAHGRFIDENKNTYPACNIRKARIVKVEEKSELK